MIAFENAFILFVSWETMCDVQMALNESNVWA